MPERRGDMSKGGRKFYHGGSEPHVRHQRGANAAKKAEKWKGGREKQLGGE